MEKKKMNPTQIADHILNECIGDNCECCDWSAEDRAALDSMTVEQAEELAFPEDRRDFDYEPPTPHDLSDDAEALASAGMGCDEDYGCYGDSDFDAW